MVEIIPGHYSAIGEKLDLLIDKSISPEALRAISNIASRLQAGKISYAEAQEEIEQVAPSLSGLFNFGEWSSEAKAILLAGIITAATTVSTNMNAPRSVGDTHITNNYYYSEGTNEGPRNTESRDSIERSQSDKKNAAESHKFKDTPYIPYSSYGSIKYRFHFN